MGIERFSPALIADNLHLVLPRNWRGEKFAGWQGGKSTPPTATASGNGPPSATAAGRGANAPPKAAWVASFWREVSLLEVATIPGLEHWPLIPITTGELVSCSMLQQVRGYEEVGGGKNQPDLTFFKVFVACFLSFK